MATDTTNIATPNAILSLEIQITDAEKLLPELNRKRLEIKELRLGKSFLD